MSGTCGTVTRPVVALFDIAAPFLRRLDPEARASSRRREPARAARAAGEGRRSAVPRNTRPGPELSQPRGSGGRVRQARGNADAMLALGFGFVEVGSVTPRPQPGNPRPRVFRLEEDRAIINRYGFNSEGLDAVAGRLRGARRPIRNRRRQRRRERGERRSAADYVRGCRGNWRGSPPTSSSTCRPPTRRGCGRCRRATPSMPCSNAFREPATTAVGGPPLLVKISPDLSDGECGEIADVALSRGVDGLIVGNTTTDRPPLRSAHREEAGGLSGRTPFRAVDAPPVQDVSADEGRLVLVGAGASRPEGTPTTRSRPARAWCSSIRRWCSKVLD